MGAAGPVRGGGPRRPPGVPRRRVLTAEEVLEHLRPRVAKWWLPDAVEFIDEVPKTSVGKFSKKTLREKFAGYTAEA